MESRLKMTTKVHIVNFGPDVVEVKTTLNGHKRLYPQESVDRYVYDGEQVTITETKTEKKTGE